MAYDINPLLLTEANRIGPDIYQKTLNSSPWNKLIKQSAWLDEMGTEITVPTYERTLPADPLTWSTVTYNTGTALSPGDNPSNNEGTCLPPNQVIPFAQSMRTYNLQHTSLNSPPICVNDLRFAFKRQEQLRMMFNVLTQNTDYAWQDRNRNEYFRNCGHKAIARSGLPENTSLSLDPNSISTQMFPAQLPTSYLTQGILSAIRMKMIRDGAGINPLGMVNGAPQFSIILSSEASDRIIRDNGPIQEDFRYAKPSELLAPLGVERSYRGFYHMIDDFMPRYNWTGAAWSRVLPYSGSAATYGTKQDISSAYENAQYEVALVFHQDVMESLIPKPITSPGGNTKFNPVTYRGEWSWKNIIDATDNPDGTIGFFRGLFSSGTKPIRPEWGWAILYQRCGDMTLTACPTS